MKLVIAAGLALTTSLCWRIDNEPAKRLGEAAAVLSEVMARPTRVFRRTCSRRHTAS